MSDNYTDDDFDLDDEDSNSIQALRRAANAAKKLKAENTRMRRELAFAKAGIPLTDPKMNYFVKGYEGDLESEAIREAAVEAGFLVVEQAAPQEQADNREGEAVAQAQRRVMAASAGATSEDISEAAAIARMEAAMQEGGLEAMLDVARQYGIPTSEEY
jgi:hypothetical protein